MSGDSPTWTTCSSELVLLARSAAVVAANLASLEPSVARRTLVGNILTGLTSLLYAPSLGVMMPQAEVQRLPPESIHQSARMVNSATFALTEYSEVDAQDVPLWRPRRRILATRLRRLPLAGVPPQIRVDPALCLCVDGARSRRPTTAPASSRSLRRACWPTPGRIRPARSATGPADHPAAASRKGTQS